MEPKYIISSYISNEGREKWRADESIEFDKKLGIGHDKKFTLNEINLLIKELPNRIVKVLDETETNENIIKHNCSFKEIRNYYWHPAVLVKYDRSDVYNNGTIIGDYFEFFILLDYESLVDSLTGSTQSIVSSTVYSDSFDEMIQKDFTYKGDKYTWNDSDCVYYNDNGDEEDFFMEIPEGAITSSKTIKSDYLPIEKWCKLFDMNNVNDIWNITDIVNETTGGGRCLPSYDISHEEFLRAYNKYKGITSSKAIKSANYNKTFDRGPAYNQLIYILNDIVNWAESAKGDTVTIEDGHDGMILKGPLFEQYIDVYGEHNSINAENAFLDLLNDYNNANPDKKYPESLFRLVWNDTNGIEIKPSMKLSSSLIKSGYYNTNEHPEGGGTCDNCHEEVMPGDGYESDFESSREMALEALVDAFKLGNIDIHDYLARQRLIDFLDMEDEDELEDAISEICNMAFEGKGYQCPTCAQMNLGIAAKAWVEDNYDLDNEIESSAIKSAKSEFGYSAHETMTFDEFKNFVKSVVEPVEMFDYKSAYFVILNNEEDCKKLDNKLDDTYGVGCTYYPLQDPYNEHHGKWQLMA